MADEANFIQLLVASERVAQWLDVIRAQRAAAASTRLKQAVKDLTASLYTEAYVEEVLLIAACRFRSRQALLIAPRLTVLPVPIAGQNTGRRPPADILAQAHR